jgi:eukaryotic-like serine/threonine-protein kinase
MTQRVAHYELVTPIGEGGMGVVYRAVDTRLGRPVAVKLLRTVGQISTEARKRFVQEARAASALNHPNIITIYDIGRHGDDDFIAMEYVDGMSLASVISEKRLGIEDALTYAIQIADALATAHAAGILHRDLKPANIMVTGKGSIKVLDFGLAKLIEPAASTQIDEGISTQSARAGVRLQTEEGTILGTPAYMSPELADGKPADARSDVFSFGAVLYEMLTGRRAFKGDTKVSTLAAILTAEPVAPSQLIHDVPLDLDRLIGRCLRKNRERRWQSMADLKVALEDVSDEFRSRSQATRPAVPGRRWSRTLVGALAIAVIGAATFGAWLRGTRSEPEPDRPRPSLTRLTSDVGWTDYPSVSLDGKMLAYASDRGGHGNLDIWVQHIPDGAPVRLTRDPADETEPSFSADASRVAFQSSRLGGGIYVVPTLGGEARLLAARGYTPRFSPDGSWIAYGIAEQGRSRIDIAPATGGPATRLTSGFYRAQAQAWSPDGHYLLLWAQRERDAPPENNTDWYIVAVPGGSPVPTQARSVLLGEGFRAFQGLPFPDAWAAGNRILFHGSIGDSSNIWYVPMSVERWRISGSPRRATFGTTDEAAPSVTSDGKMVFISRALGADIWSLPIDTNRGKVQGPPKRVTQDAADDYDPTLSDDGNTLVFRSRRNGRFAVILKRAGSAEETVLTRTPVDHYPAVSRDGTRIAYSFLRDGKMPIFIVDASGGAPEQVCDDCGEIEEWSSRADEILYVTPHDPSGVGIVKIGAPKNDAWLRHPGYGIYNARLSSDGGWVVFNARTDRLAPAAVFVAKVQGDAVSPRKDWILVSADGDAPRWSPHASLLYFWSERDGSPCLWAQRVDPTTKRPVGVPLNIQHFHSRGLSWRNLYLGAADIAVARDRIVFNLGEQSGNVWMTELPPVK